MTWVVYQDDLDIEDLPLPERHWCRACLLWLDTDVRQYRKNVWLCAICGGEYCDTSCAQSSRHKCEQKPQAKHGWVRTR